VHPGCCQERRDHAPGGSDAASSPDGDAPFFGKDTLNDLLLAGDRQISRRIPKAQQTISAVVARLEKLGLIERRFGSGRGVGLHATDTGREMAQVAVTHKQELNARLRELLGEERSTALTELLRESRAILREAR
jgi:DNA-binding MarR family transcriptional regulator